MEPLFFAPDPGQPTARATGGRVRTALLTPRGRGALAVISLAGPGACGLADCYFEPRGGIPLAARADGAICVGTWRPGEPPDSSGEELVVVRHAADELEIHCHGGLAAPEAVLASLVAGGAVRQDWKTWLETPYQKRRQETEQHAIERESRLALALVAGPRAARILTRQLTGCLDQELVRLAALGPGPDRLAAAERLLRAARVGLRVADPWRVVLAGPVNAGKSSLVNALAGHARSIVSAEPGTTRDLVTTRLVLGGWEIALVDTAGLRTTESAASATERAGIARAVAAAKAADLVLEVAAADGDGARATSADGRVLVVITKADLAPTAWSPPVGAILTSVKEHRGIAELAAAIVARLVPEEQEDPDLLAGPVPFTARQVELIRRLGRGCG